MNTYKKYAPNVFVASCENEHKKGDIITLTSRHGKEREHNVHNFLGKYADSFLYSITPLDGFNAQKRAEAKADKIQGYADNARSRGEELQGKSSEGKDFLSLGEPIKIGHHSEGRHRALIDRNWKRMEKAVGEYNKAEEYESRISYWEKKAKEINLSMPESLHFFSAQRDEAVEYHSCMKSGEIQKSHSFSLTYAKKRVNDLTKKVELAEKLWGV